MKSDEFKRRTRAAALRVIHLVDSLPSTVSGQVLARQLVKSATSVGANYRAACRARSRAEFISKLGIAEEEADECCYWLELLLESGKIRSNPAEDLLREFSEITAIVVKSIRTARGRAKR